MTCIYGYQTKKMKIRNLMFLKVLRSFRKVLLPRKMNRLVVNQHQKIKRVLNLAKKRKKHKMKMRILVKKKSSQKQLIVKSKPRKMKKAREKKKEELIIS